MCVGAKRTGRGRGGCTWTGGWERTSRNKGSTSMLILCKCRCRRNTQQGHGGFGASEKQTDALCSRTSISRRRLYHPPPSPSPPPPPPPLSCAEMRFSDIECDILFSGRYSEFVSLPPPPPCHPLLFVFSPAGGLGWKGEGETLRLRPTDIARPASASSVKRR